MCVCVRVRACAGARARVCVCIWFGGWVGEKSLLTLYNSEYEHKSAIHCTYATIPMSKEHVAISIVLTIAL